MSDGAFDVFAVPNSMQLVAFELSLSLSFSLCREYIGYSSCTKVRVVRNIAENRRGVFASKGLSSPENRAATLSQPEDNEIIS